MLSTTFWGMWDLGSTLASTLHHTHSPLHSHIPITTWHFNRHFLSAFVLKAPFHCSWHWLKNIFMQDRKWRESPGTFSQPGDSRIQRQCLIWIPRLTLHKHFLNKMQSSSSFMCCPAVLLFGKQRKLLWIKAICKYVYITIFFIMCSNFLNSINILKKINLTACKWINFVEKLK